MTDDSELIISGYTKPPRGGWPPAKAQDLLDSATSFQLGASRLVESIGDDDGLNPLNGAFYMLASFSIELSLKAMCRHAGASNKEVAALGHNLQAAYAMAIPKGPYRGLDHFLGLVCGALDMLHLNHVFRYTPAVDGIAVPPPFITNRVATCQIERVTALLAGEIEPGSPYDLVLMP